MKDLKERTIRGGLARSLGLGARFALRLGTLMVLARLLAPKDFGLVGMVTAFTGVLDLFRDFGLSAATIQSANVTIEQKSTLFWINIAFGCLLAGIMIAMAPVIAAFYHEPRLVRVTIVLAAGLILNAAAVQHSALLQREMRFTTLTAIDVTALTLAAVVAIVGAKAGFGYWALVAMTITLPLATAAGVWLTSGWIPGLPRRGAGVRPMMRFGGTLTVTGLTVYLANNLDKVLLGRYWGVDALGLYGRAYQLINIPTSNLNSAAGEVAFSALSRLQDDPPRRRSYFLKGFSLVLGLTLPITVACAFFARGMVLVLLGPKWEGAVPIFRLLAPTILVFAVANPLSWLLSASGLIARQMKMSLVIAPGMILGYVVGLPYGPRGVAFAYSLVMTLWVFPLIAWAVHGTEISFRDVMRTAGPPLIASAAAGAVAFAVGMAFCRSFVPLLRLSIECSVLLVAFIGFLMMVAGQRTLYLGLLRGVIGSVSGRARVAASI
ncbi:MAG: lipopolysaccharide biosynthesis protein [Acidobacteriaceae bacterium]